MVEPCRTRPVRLDLRIGGLVADVVVWSTHGWNVWQRLLVMVLHVALLAAIVGDFWLIDRTLQTTNPVLHGR